MNFFVVEDEYTLFTFIYRYESFCRVEDEYTYYLRLFLRLGTFLLLGRRIHILFKFIYLRS